MQIPIIIEDLKSICQIDDEAAQQIIKRTKTVRIGETLIEPKRQKDGFIVNAKAPTNPDDDLLVIYLIDEDGGTITLAFDLKAGKFRQPVPDLELAASASTNPQADPGRDLELALQVGTKAALYVFLNYHPDGLYADLANAQLQKIEAEEAAANKA
jgi:hypothetical protein